jgi:short-subunit dehydrogenase
VSGFAVVTGASSGIGLELAKQFDEHGYDLLLCAEDAVDAAVQGKEVIQADLRTPDGVQQLYDAIDDRPVDALALNAGVGQGGAFVDQSLEDILSIVSLNVASTVHLARLVLPGMVARGSGRVLITSSIASMMPGSYQAVYNASKSFVQSWTQALQVELRGSGVTLTALMPGPTDTAFFERADMSDTRVGQGSKDDAAQVAAQGFAAMQAGKGRVVGGGLNTRVQYWGGVLLPDAAKAAMHAVIARPRGN